MKVVTTTAMHTAAPSECFIHFVTGRPILYCDGSSFPYNAGNDMPVIDAAIRLSYSEMLEIASNPLVAAEFNRDLLYYNYTYYQFKDVLRAFGYNPNEFTVAQLRVVLEYIGYLMHAFQKWTDVIVDLMTKSSSIKYKLTDTTKELEQLGLIVVGWSNTRAHMQLTPKGYRLALALRTMYTDLLADAVPGQYTSKDHRGIAYLPLWNERQGNVKMSTETTLAAISKFLGE